MYRCKELNGPGPWAEATRGKGCHAHLFAYNRCTALESGRLRVGSPRILSSSSSPSSPFSSLSSFPAVFIACDSLSKPLKLKGEMALLLSHTTSFSPLCSSFQSLAISSHTFSRLPKTSLSSWRRSVDGVWFHSSISLGERSAIIVRASSDMDAKEPDITNMPRESAEEATSVVETLPLESKQQMILEQRQRMKLAKKIRLKRKRLLRKRRMRKKGRWPPSKMRKLKNV